MTFAETIAKSLKENDERIKSARLHAKGAQTDESLNELVQIASSHQHILKAILAHVWGAKAVDG